MATLRAERFTVSVSDEVLADLRARIRNTRWPDAAPGASWEQGTDLGYLLAYWADGFDWRAQERWLNGFRHFRASVDGVHVHLCTSGPGFDVVIPSLPGYGFSERSARTGVTSRYTAGLWHRLMRGLGYRRYGAQGSDFGSAVATFMALDDPGPMLGIHLSNLDVAPYTGPGSRPPSAAERAIWPSTADGVKTTAATARSSRRGRRRSATGSTTHRAGWLPRCWRSGGHGRIPEGISTPPSPATSSSRW